MERQLASFALRRHIVALSLVVQHSCAGQAGDRGTHGGTLVGWARGRTPSSRRAQASRRHHRDASACLPPSGRRCLGQRFDSCVCHERRESTVASSIAVGWTAGGGGAAASLTTAGKKAGAAGGLPGWLRNLRVPSAQVDKEIYGVLSTADTSSQSPMGAGRGRRASWAVRLGRLAAYAGGRPLRAPANFQKPTLLAPPQPLLRLQRQRGRRHARSLARAGGRAGERESPG
jgi:hypothetical protein